MAFLNSEPELDPGTMMMAEAYVDLSSCRTFTLGGIGPIPWLAMKEWALFNEIPRHIAKHVWRVIKCVDRETLRRAAERNKPKKRG